MTKIYFATIKGFDEDMLITEYDNILELLNSLYCKKNLVSILANADLNKLLPLLLKDFKR